jgi:hypothetical protein
MYVSHKYKLIFLRTPKTASSSLSEFFIKNIPDPDAIYTPVEDSGIGGTLSEKVMDKYKLYFAYYHFTLQDLVDNNIITLQQALEYRSIAVIRNPVDRQKSFYYFYKRWKQAGSESSLAQYKAWTPQGFFRGEPNSSILQSSILEYNGEIKGDYWLYPNIGNELSKLMRELNLQTTHPLPNHKNDFRTNRDDEIVFDKEALDVLSRHFGADIELYNGLAEETYV